MAIVIIRQDGNIESWKRALLETAPDTEIYSYLEDYPKEKITMALVWKHPEGSLRDYPNLQCIASFGAGVDFIFEDPYRPDGIPVTRVVDPKLASDMSEFVIGQILSYLKNFYQYKLDQTQLEWNPRNYRRIEDITVGIMGIGELGTTLAKDLNKLNFKVLGWVNSTKKDIGIPIYAGPGERDEFLSQTNVLICLLPLTKATREILNRELFSFLPQRAYVINVARGGHLNDKDLLKMIDSGHLSGASLDVFHSEPLPEGHPFWKHPKIHITPHIASVSDIPSVTPQILENYQRLQSGRSLRHLVSPDKGY
jgi:glyoxylate/hydroxypyruvate reductase A